MHKNKTNHQVELSNLPVKVVFRLCTDNDNVVDFFSSLDSKLDCDVLGEFSLF